LFLVGFDSKVLLVHRPSVSSQEVEVLEVEDHQKQEAEVLEVVDHQKQVEVLEVEDR